MLEQHLLACSAPRAVAFRAHKSALHGRLGAAHHGVVGIWEVGSSSKRLIERESVSQGTGLRPTSERVRRIESDVIASDHGILPTCRGLVQGDGIVGEREAERNLHAHDGAGPWHSGKRGRGLEPRWTMACAVLVHVVLACGSAGSPSALGDAGPKIDAEADAGQGLGDTGPSSPDGGDAGPEVCGVQAGDVLLERQLVVRVSAGGMAALSNARTTVRVGGLSLEGVTDTDGCVQFILDAPTGGTDEIAVEANGYATAIRVGSPFAENRFVLSTRTGAVPGQATGRFQGLVTSLDMIGTPTSATSSWIGRVVPIVEDVFLPGAPPRRMLPDGRRTGEIVVGPNLNRPDFEMEVYAEASLGLGAYAGATNANGDWKPDAIGWRRGTVAPGAVESGFDVPLLSRTTVTGAITIPSGLPSPLRAVFVTLRLPGGGWMLWPAPTNGIDLPALEGPLAGGEYGYLVYGGPDAALSIGWVRGTVPEQVLREPLPPRDVTVANGMLILDPVPVGPDPVLCRVLGATANGRAFELLDFTAATRIELPESVVAELHGAVDVTVNCERAPGWTPSMGPAWRPYVDAFSTRSVELQLP